MDRDDLHQEALIILATSPDKVRQYVDGGDLPHLYQWLRGRVLDTVKYETDRSVRTSSNEVRLERLLAAE